MLHHLELSALINWNTEVVWEARPVHQPASVSVAVGARKQEEQWISVVHLTAPLEEGYHKGPVQTSFSSGLNTFQVDYNHKQLINHHTGGMFELRRLAFAPLMPLKVCSTSSTCQHYPLQ